MDNSFILQLANIIINNSNDIDYKDTIIILPNKRASRILLKEIALAAGKPIFSPAIYTINDLIETISPIRKISDFELLINLYNVYQNFEISKGEDFQSFLSWAPTFLSDINEIDMQLVDSSAIFCNLADIKELETSFSKESLSESQQRYIEFYQNLSSLYTQYNLLLKEKKIGYEGLIYKDVACQIEPLAHQLNYKRYIFAGFHTLSPAEIIILKHYYTHYQTEFYFDLDEFYYHQFSPFIELLKNELKISKLNWIQKDYATIDKEIHVVGQSKIINQINYAIEKLNEIELEEGNLNNTALVFADESLLIPFVHAYNCSHSNLSMGYPFTATPAYNLIRSIIDMAKSSVRFSEENKSTRSFYFRDLISLFQNPIIINSLFRDNNAYNESFTKLRNSNKTFLSIEDNDILKQLPNLFCNGLEMITNIQHFFKTLLDANRIDQPSQYELALLIDKLEEAQQMLRLLPESEVIGLTTIDYILNELLSSLSIPFLGSVDNGLQIMGLLETRMLDFNNIIILSVNEGVLPKGKSTPSLIMNDVKAHFKIPTSQYKDSVYAYHFFRFLQRARRVFITYNTDSSTSLAEKSRFINQLEFEIKKNKLTNIQFKNDDYFALPKQINNSSSLEIPKTEQIVELLKKLYYSPSKLNTYINCPLQFYLSFVAKIEPELTINEKIEQNILGNIIHRIFQNLFNQFAERHKDVKTIISDAINAMDKIVITEFNNEDTLKGQDFTQGYLFLAVEVVKKYTLSYLKYLENDNSINSLNLVGTEQKLCCQFPIDNETMILFGLADRIEIQANTHTILDYKTGKVKDMTFSDFETLFTDTKQSQLFQLIYYSFIYYMNNETNELIRENGIACGIISFLELGKSKSKGIVVPTFQYNNAKTNKLSVDFLREFGENLKELWKEITDISIPFKQTEDVEHCKYCNYKQICRK